MKNQIWIAIWAICTLVCTADAALWDRTNVKHSRQLERAPAVRALIVHDLPKAMLEVKGKYAILDAQGGEYSSRVHGKCRMIESTPAGLTWGEVFLDRFKITLVPTGRDSIFMVNGTPYRGSLTIQGFRDSLTLSIVNTVDVEDYLASVLGTQIDQAYPTEALNAVAIAERTNVYNQTQRPKNEHWDVDAQQTGYAGLGLFARADDVNKALLATRYMVLGRSAESPDDVVLVPVKWKKESTQRGVLSLAEAVKQAESGQHAGQILGGVVSNAAITRVFP